MEIIAVKTRSMVPPQDDIYSLIDEFCPRLVNRDVLIIASKIVAIHQGRCLLKSKVKNKDDLIEKEADVFIPRKQCPKERAILTIKKNTLLPSAGIDESNANDYYILWPTKPDQEAKKICLYLKKKFSLKKLAVIIADSHCVPLRTGTIGISIGFYGFEPLKDYRGKKDIFNRTLKITQANLADALAAAGVLMMGEGNEKKPLAIVRGLNFLKFTRQETGKKLAISAKKDIFYPLLKNFY